MDTYMLEGATRVTLRHRPITISARVDGGVGARLVAISSGLPVLGTVSPRPDLLILPQLTEGVTVRVIPVGAERFSEQSVLHIDAAGESTNGQQARAVLAPIVLAGLDARDLIVLEPVDGLIQLRASRIVERLPLSDLANAARVVTTEILGAEAVDDGVAIDAVIAVDSSASFRPIIAAGAALAVVEILVGVMSVIAPARSVRGATVGSRARAVPVSGLSGLAAELIDVMATSRPSTGFRSGAAGLVSASPESNTITYLVTDEIPSDVAEFDAANRVAGEARHLVVIGSTAAVDLQGRPASPCTVVDHDSGAIPIRDRYLADDHGLRVLVRALLVGCFAPGTSAAERVGG